MTHLPPYWQIDKTQLPHELFRPFTWDNHNLIVRLVFQRKSRIWTDERYIVLNDGNGLIVTQTPKLRSYFRATENGLVEDLYAVCKEADRMLARLQKCSTCDSPYFTAFRDNFCSKNCLNMWEAAHEE